MRRFLAFAALVLAALACSFEVSTARFEDVRLFKDPTATERARVYRSDETFHARLDLRDAPADTQIRAVWRRLPTADDAGSEIDRTEIETGSGVMWFQAVPPEEGWTPGEYVLDLYLDGDKKQTVEFEVTR